MPQHDSKTLLSTGRPPLRPNSCIYVCVYEARASLADHEMSNDTDTHLNLRYISNRIRHSIAENDFFNFR